MEYFKADDEMVDLCREMVEKYHGRLGGATIAIICKDKASKSAGRTVLASASLVSKKMKPLLDDNYDFIITIAYSAWNKLTDKQKAALIDHELCHCDWNDNGDPCMIGHDYEEFGQIIQRHGMWREDEGETKVTQAMLFSGEVKIQAPELRKVSGE